MLHDNLWLKTLEYEVLPKEAASWEETFRYSFMSALFPMSILLTSCCANLIVVGFELFLLINL